MDFFVFCYLVPFVFIFVMLNNIRGGKYTTKADKKIAARLQFASFIWPISLPIGLLILFIVVIKSTWKDMFIKEDK